MSEDPLEKLSEMASEAHTRIQQTYEHINPMLGLRRGLRDSGIPADVMTIDCLRTRRRIVLILHDEQPGTLLYQFLAIEEDPDGDFQLMALSEVGVETLFEWMRDYFSDQE